MDPLLVIETPNCTNLLASATPDRFPREKQRGIYRNLEAPLRRRKNSAAGASSGEGYRCFLSIATRGTGFDAQRLESRREDGCRIYRSKKMN